MAVGALGVALTFGNAAFSTVTMISIMVYSASFSACSHGVQSLGFLLPSSSQYYPWCCSGYCRCLPVDIELHRQLYFRAYVQYAPSAGDDLGHWLTYGLYGAICILAAIFVWKLVPETKGKTLEDMSKLWRQVINSCNLYSWIRLLVGERVKEGRIRRYLSVRPFTVCSA